MNKQKQCQGKRINSEEQVTGWYIEYHGQSFITDWPRCKSFLGGFVRVTPESVSQLPGDDE